ncbi:3-ketosteroid 9alpha-monooxygenase subunit B [Amycolatopsis arida]|uniref:3-ketosteroid 9alpha-monooxygenase subunit B n=1 Tax=Amycolatopsis arida TaxID=587909 RepID=A0A1I5VMS8_9PSEU|nr:ferredoxin--NADP reductase [Amycolatopsis arida]TDX87958.1 3-ketosteroid 9alpha-monooxygenase subunit B [Amycolatopsis arida]SFQ08799.1 3-ketosteroid 9alpha-monooxygenase subunit B [Amycolatopsis arida]
MGERSHVLRVVEVVEETAEARSIVFAPTPEQADQLTYRPGQFLTVRVPSDRCGSVARCYSLSSSPLTGEPPRVTVKRTEGGYASHWICDNVTAGGELEVLPPSGVFTPASLDTDLLLFAAGSGITPVLSIVTSVLVGGSGRLVLVYANRDERSVIFASRLRELAAAHPDRLTVVHWLESVQGLPDTERLRALAAPFAEREAFVCGPRPFMTATTTALKALGLPRARIHTEKFVSLGGNPFETTTPAEPAAAPTEPTEQPATVEVELDGARHEFAWPRDRRLLDLLLERGLDVPFSCREGQCSACACRLVSGEVKMLHNEVLEPEDIDEGIVLACQSVPVTDEISVSYE